MSENLPTEETVPSAYIPQEKIVPTSFYVIMFVYKQQPAEQGKAIEEETTELIQLAYPNMDTSLDAFTVNQTDNTGHFYHQSISNNDSYYLIPLEENQELAVFTLFGLDQGEVIDICNRQDFSDYTEQTVTNYPYTFHYYLFNIASLGDYNDFTITDTYLDTTNLPIPDTSDYPATITPVSKNTIVTANDTNQSYIYTDNGWQLFANNTENITEEETELFIQGLINYINNSSGSDDGSGDVMME